MVPQAPIPQPLPDAPERSAARTLPQREAPTGTAPKSPITDQASSPLRQSVSGPTQPVDARITYPCPQDLAAQCREARLAEISYAKQYYESMAQELALRRRAFEWHEFSTKLLFCSVLTITGMGLILSWREFGKYYAPKRPAIPVAAVGPESVAEDPPQSVFKVGAQGLEVTSSLIGFLVLSTSLAFFHLYVVNVYPLYELARVQATTSSHAEVTIRRGPGAVDKDRRAGPCTVVLVTSGTLFPDGIDTNE